MPRDGAPTARRTGGVVPEPSRVEGSRRFPNAPELDLRVGWLGRKDSNLRMADPKSAALPLGYSPVAPAIVASPRRQRGICRWQARSGLRTRSRAPRLVPDPGSFRFLGG